MRNFNPAGNGPARDMPGRPGDRRPMPALAALHADRIVCFGNTGHFTPRNLKGEAALNSPDVFP